MNYRPLHRSVRHKKVFPACPSESLFCLQGAVSSGITLHCLCTSNSYSICDLEVKTRLSCWVWIGLNCSLKVFLCHDDFNDSLIILTALRLKQEHIQLTVRRTGDWNQLLVVSGISCFWQDSWIIPGENTEERRQTNRKEKLKVKQ